MWQRGIRIILYYNSLDPRIPSAEKLSCLREEHMHLISYGRPYVRPSDTRRAAPQNNAAHTRLIRGIPVIFAAICGAYADSCGTSRLHPEPQVPLLIQKKGM